MQDLCYIDANLALGPLVDGIRWYRLEGVELQIGKFESQLFTTKSTLALLQQQALLLPWINAAEDYWAQEYEGMVGRARREHLSAGILRSAQHLALRRDYQTAWRLLVTHVERTLLERVAHLRRRLRLARNIIKSRLAQIISRSTTLHNLITLQRRFYLAHGAHPSDLSAQPKGWSTTSVGGYAPAFVT